MFTSFDFDVIQHSLPYLWQGYTLAVQLHDAPHIQQATTILRQMQAQHDPVTFARIWRQVLGIALPDWIKW